MKETIAPVTSVVANGTSVTHFYSPSLQGSTTTLSDLPSHRPLFSTCEESLFLRHGDYWTIQYHGQVAFLKATRGLHCICVLLRYPGREFHVSELLGQVIGRPLASEKSESGTDDWQANGLFDAGPILDSQAKVGCKRRIDELREDLDEAERFNDPGRADRARSEMNAIVEQLAAAVGFGRRDRRLGSDAERARSTVTKRIKHSINKIGESIPSLRSHLAARIKTGYFCSYNPQPERPVAWKF